MSAAACKPSRSASTIVAATASGYHLLKINGYSRTKGVPHGQKLQSRPFSLGGHQWYIGYYPNGFNSDHTGCISPFLFLDDSVTTAVKAQHEFCFIDEVKDQALSLASSAVSEFASKQGWGTSKLIKRADFEKSKHLKDDSFIVRCDVIVINDYRAEDLPENTPPTFVSVAPSSLHQHLGDLLKTEKGADVVFEVGRETFAAHRCMLAARSTVFGAELFGVTKEGDTACVIRVDDIEAQVFKALLCFAYTDSLSEARNEEEDVMCQHLLVAADMYNMDRLKTICEDKLCKYINVGTVATILALAEQHHCDGLETACFHFLRTPAKQI
ncbi:BTB/POZ and MATH domain-containing protein 2 [Brachypodium distachyon]|uniref:BTB/POZ and MATH domain-containing protein 2 n=1 Tax=Brachypodium distachyon TaxID=15368 RepID=UPI0001D437CC|nr:BTB/POZ and MATH domain-containing protein 2 [Brachypodium distachyon]|eukprot:XP_014756230.1 BTB/POZ and MATH domain-containing protein 2 [Brachypodium distachyon]